MVPSARIKTIHFPEVAIMGGPNRPSYDRVAQQATPRKNMFRLYPTTKRKPREKRQAGRLKYLPCLIGIGDSTATYAEQSRLRQSADHRNSSHTSPPRVATTQLKSCLKATADEGWVPEGINEFKPTVQTCTTNDDTMIEPSLFLACCDEERHQTQLCDAKSTESAPRPDQIAQRPPSTGNDGSERDYALRATKVASVQEIPQEGTTIEIITRPSNHVEYQARANRDRSAQRLWPSRSCKCKTLTNEQAYRRHTGWRLSIKAKRGPRYLDRFGARYANPEKYLWPWTLGRT